MGYYIDVLAPKADDQALDDVAGTSISEDLFEGIVSINISLSGEDNIQLFVHTILELKDEVDIIIIILTKGYYRLILLILFI